MIFYFYLCRNSASQSWKNEKRFDLFKQHAWLRRNVSSSKFVHKSLELRFQPQTPTTTRLLSWCSRWCLDEFYLLCACTLVRVWFLQVNQITLESCHRALYGQLLVLQVLLKQVNKFSSLTSNKLSLTWSPTWCIGNFHCKHHNFRSYSRHLIAEAVGVASSLISGERVFTICFSVTLKLFKSAPEKRMWKSSGTDLVNNFAVWSNYPHINIKEASFNCFKHKTW